LRLKNFQIDLFKKIDAFPRQHIGSRVARWFIVKPDLGKFWRALELKMLIYFTVIWNVSLPFGIFYGHLVMI
jgi:hypothetical protein